MKQFVGCDLLLYAEVTEDNASFYKTTKPEKLGALKGIVLPPSRIVNTVNKEGFPVAFYTTETSGGYIQISTGGLAEDFVAYLTGQGDYGQGFAIDTGEQVKRFFALGFRALYTDDTYKYVWFQKGVFQKQSVTINTKQGTESVGDVLFYFPTFTEKRFTINNKKCRSITIESDKVERVINSDYWASTVWTPDNLLEVAEPVILPYTDVLNVGENIIINGAENSIIEYEVIE